MDDNLIQSTQPVEPIDQETQAITKETTESNPVNNNSNENNQKRNLLPILLIVGALFFLATAALIAFIYTNRSKQVGTDLAPQDILLQEPPQVTSENSNLDQDILNRLMFEEIDEADPIYVSAFDFESITVGNLTLQIPTSNHPDNITEVSNFDDNTSLELESEYYDIQRVLHLNTISDYYEPIYSKILNKVEGQSYSTSYVNLAGFLNIDQITEPGIQSEAEYTNLINNLFSEEWCAEQFEEGYIYEPLESTIYKTKDSGASIYNYVPPICVNSSTGGSLPTNQYLIDKNNQVYIFDETQDPFPASVIEKILESID